MVRDRLRRPDNTYATGAGQELFSLSAQTLFATVSESEIMNYRVLGS